MSHLNIDGDRLDKWITGHWGQDQFEDRIPPDPTEDAGGDPDERLMDATRRLLEIMAAWGLDYFAAYSEALAALDAKERARNEGAKRRATA